MGYFTYIDSKGTKHDLTICCGHAHSDHILKSKDEQGNYLRYPEWKRLCSLCDCEDHRTQPLTEAIRKFDGREPNKMDGPCKEFAVERGEELINSINTGRCTHQDKYGRACND